MRKQRMKYSLMGIIGIFGAIYLIIIGGTTHANNDWDKFFYEGGSLGNDMNTDYGLLIKSDAVKKKEGILYNIMEIFKLNGEEYQGEKKALFYAKKLLNYGLGFVSFIALGLVLYSFYGLLIGDGDKQYAQVKSTLKGVAIAIAIMGVSWFIVSLLFWIYNKQILAG